MSPGWSGWVASIRARHSESGVRCAVVIPAARSSSTNTELGDQMSATAAHHTKTTDDSWDGPATEARIPEDASPTVLKKVFAWTDPKEQENKTAYKFPHHEVSRSGGVGAANEKACSNGIAILNGGRGGADIPKADRSRIYRHLAT